MRKLKKYLEIAIYNSNDPLLESYLEELTINEPPRHLKRAIELLKITAAHYQLVSLSANQISMKHRMFAILKENRIVTGKWGGYQAQPDDFEVVVNPQLVRQTSLKFKDFEECPSIPGMKFAIWNPILQTYRYQIPLIGEREVSFKQAERTLKGFKARLWDHEVRHLNGILAFDEDISHRQVYVNEDFRQNPGMHGMVELMKSDLKLMGEQNLTKMFKQGMQGQKGLKKSKVLPNSMDQLPDKISREMKSQLGKQYDKIQSVLAQQLGKQDDKKDG